MYQKSIQCAFLILLASFAINTQATSINLGELSTNNDGSTEIISDSLNNYEWLRLDVLASHNYAQTLQAISPGDIYEGWQIAHNAEAQAFINAMFVPDTASCGISTTPDCGQVTFSDSDLGGNFDNSNDFVFFVSDNNIGHEVGIIQLTSLHISKDDEWASFAESDFFSSTGNNSSLPISWLLYRDLNANQIDEPTSLPLMLLSLLLMPFFMRASPKQHN